MPIPTLSTLAIAALLSGPALSGPALSGPALSGTALSAATAPDPGQDEWNAPRDAAARENPVAVSDEILEAGGVLFGAACASCHGKTGKGDGFAAGMLRRKPKNLGEVTGAQTDGEVFWKIRTGNDVMPSSASALSEEETWQLIHFLRTLEVEAPRTHPWASFPGGAWVEVHTDHRLVETAGDAETVDASDSRVTVVESGSGAVTLRQEIAAKKIDEETTVAVPSVAELPGVRAIGQWPHEIFPFAQERDAGVLPEHKRSKPREVETKTLRRERIELNGTSRRARVVERRWREGAGDESRRHVLTAWIVNGVKVPARWSLDVDGKTVSESEVVSLSEAVEIEGVTVACIVTLTKRQLPEGVAATRRWSSASVPGFLVKSEMRLKTEAFSLAVDQWVTDFEAAPAAAEASAPVAADADADEGNPPGSRPALGIMPDYESGADGVLVHDVSPGGPADEGGIEAGDLIVEIDGDAILGLDDYMTVMPTLRIGKEVKVKVKRDGKNVELGIVVGERDL